MKEIELTQGQVAMVDDFDFEWLNQFKWQAHNDGRTYYATRHLATVNGLRPTISMHRFILDAPKNMQVDHRDQNGLNCQRYNIRICTRRQNAQNRNSYKGTSSVYKGVSWNIGSEKWHAHIRYNGKLIALKSYHSEIKAALAYDQACIELFGEFARPNFNNHKQTSLNLQSF